MTAAGIEPSHLQKVIAEQGTIAYLNAITTTLSRTSYKSKISTAIYLLKWLKISYENLNLRAAALMLC